MILSGWKIFFNFFILSSWSWSWFLSFFLSFSFFLSLSFWKIRSKYAGTQNGNKEPVPSSPRTDTVSGCEFKRNQFPYLIIKHFHFLFSCCPSSFFLCLFLDQSSSRNIHRQKPKEVTVEKLFFKGRQSLFNPHFRLTTYSPYSYSPYSFHHPHHPHSSC